MPEILHKGASETRKNENIRGFESITSMLALKKNLANFAITSPRLPRRIKPGDEIIMILLKFLQLMDQDEGVGRHTMPPRTTKRRTTTI